MIQLIKHKERHNAKGNGFGWKPIDMSVNGGGTHGQLKQKATTVQAQTLLLSKQATVIEKETTVANTLMARDYKGFGNQPMNAVMEITPQGAK